MLLTMFWGSLGLVFGALGGFLGALFCAFGNSRWLFEFSKLIFFAALSPHLGSQGALNRPQHLPRRAHGKTDSPTKLPRPVWIFPRF